MASYCDNVNGAKSPQKKNSFWCRFPWKAMAGQLCGKWSRPQLYQEVGKGSYSNGLSWAMKMAVIVSCSGKTRLLKASGMGKMKDVGSLCCWVCAGVLVCWWCWEVHFMIALLPVQVEVEESRTAWPCSLLLLHILNTSSDLFKNTLKCVIIQKRRGKG